MTEIVDGRPARASCSRPTAPTWPRPSRSSRSPSCRSSTGTSRSSSCSRRAPSSIAGTTPPSENPQGSTQTMVNGQTFSGTGYQLDGTENRDPILGIIVINPNLEAIGETKITSQNYDAEFGQATAGVVSVQTKSGHEHSSTAARSSSPGATSSRPATRSRSRDGTNALTGKYLPDTKRDQFGGLDRRPDRARTSCSSSATTRARATPRAARGCSRCRRPPRGPGT